MATSKLLIFLIEKSFMLFCSELIYSFYTLCTGVPLVPAVNEYLLEIWFLSLLPAAYYLFEGDYDYNTIIKNPKLFRSTEKHHFNGKNIVKGLAIVALQSLIIVFVVMYSLAEAVDSTGTIKGHEMTGFFVFFCIFHTLLFKYGMRLLRLAVSGEQISWHQAILLVAGVLLYYLTMAIFCSQIVATAIDISQRNIIASVFKGQGYLLAATVTMEASIIDMMILLNQRVFTKKGVRIEKPVKKEKELSQHELAVFNLPQ